MDKTIVERPKGPQILEIIIGGVASLASLAIVYLTLTGQLTAQLVLWGSGAIVAAAVGGLFVYVLAAIVGGTRVY